MFRVDRVSFLKSNYISLAERHVKCQQLRYLSYVGDTTVEVLNTVLRRLLFCRDPVRANQVLLVVIPVSRGSCHVKEELLTLVLFTCIFRIFRIFPWCNEGAIDRSFRGY